MIIIVARTVPDDKNDRYSYLADGSISISREHQHRVTGSVAKLKKGEEQFFSSANALLYIEVHISAKVGSNWIAKVIL